MRIFPLNADLSTCKFHVVTDNTLAKENLQML